MLKERTLSYYNFTSGLFLVLTFCGISLLFSSCSEEDPHIDLSYSGDQLEQIACPLGGIGTGNILLNGFGAIRDIEIWGRPSMDELPPNMTFFSLYTKQGDDEPVIKILEREYSNIFPNPFGKPRQQLGGLPRFRDASFHNAYPFVYLNLIDEEVVTDVKLTAWSPFVPLDTELSALPCAVMEWTLSNPSKDPVDFALSFSMSNPMFASIPGEWRPREGCTITPFVSKNWKGFTFSSPESDSMEADAGQFRLMFPSESTLSVPLAEGGWWDNAHIFWEEFSKDGRLARKIDTVSNPGAIAQSAAMSLNGTLAEGESKTIPFIFSWYVPYRNLEASQSFGNKSVEGIKTRNYYATKYNGITEVSRVIEERYEEMRRKTLDYSRVMTASTVSPEVLDAAISNAASLKTNLLMQDEDGRLHGFEGLGNDFGCCAGNCTHVWNYAQTMAALFPSLERNVRETSFLFDTHDNGYQCFRTVFPISDNWFKNIAADGQMGNIMRVYREWKISGNDEWLGLLWPKVKRALEFAWKGVGEMPPGFEWMKNCPIPWDPNKEGVLRGDQHNTYDINFYGPNMLTGSLYLGALKACSEMAMHMNEPQKSLEYKQLYEKGRKRYTELLWNGSYYEQKVEILEGVEIPEHLKSPDTEEETVLPKYQYGTGCLSDQLLGQYLAFITGLGYLMDTANTQTALKSIYTNNFRKEMRDFDNVQRIYAANDEPGLVLCTWPDGDKPLLPFVYSDEVWTGVEYQVATSLIYAGLVEEGLEITAAVRSRYSGANRNPFAEIESGRYYARAMSSWGVYQAMAGYSYDGLKKKVCFAPAIDVLPVRYFWSTGQAWGSIELERGGIEMKCLHGQLKLENLEFKGKSFFVFREFVTSQPVNISYDNFTLKLHFEQPLVLIEGESFKMDIP